LSAQVRRGGPVAEMKREGGRLVVRFPTVR